MSEENENMQKIATYKGVDIFYSIQDGRLYFEFEGERNVNYLFEAKRIIDEPKWEDCDLKGFFLDHSLEYHIGLAKATKRDIKSGRPDWLYKGKYSMGYKKSDTFREDKTKVYPITAETKKLYNDWKAQRDVAVKEQQKADNIAQQLKEQKGY